MTEYRNENRLMIARSQGWKIEGNGEEESGHKYKRAAQVVLVVMELFCILTVSISLTWLCYSFGRCYH